MRTKLLLVLLVVVGLLWNNTPINGAGNSKRQVITAANASQLQELHLLGQGEVRNLRWSPDGKLFIVATTRGVWLYNAADLLAAPYRLDPHPARDVAFNADGSQLATYSEYGPISIWNIKTRELVRQVTIPDQDPANYKNRVFDVTFKPSNKLYITVGYEIWNGFYVLDEETNKVLVDEKQTEVVNDVTISPDQKTVAVTFGELVPPQYVQVWNLSTGKSIGKMEGIDSRPNNVVFTTDGSLIATANGNTPSDYGGLDDNVVALWDGKTYKKIASMGVDTGEHDSFANAKNMVKRVAFSPHGKVIASGHLDGTVRLWDTQTHRMRLALKTNGGIVNALAFNPDGTLLAAATGGGLLQVWRLSDGQVQYVLNGFTGVSSPYVGPGDADQSCCLVFSADGNMAAFGQFNAIIPVWDTNTGYTLRLLQGHKDVISSVAFAADNKTMASTGWDATVRLWDVKSGILTQTLDLNSKDAPDFELATGASLSPDGKYMTFYQGYNSVSLELYKTNPLTKIHENGDVHDTQFSPDSRLVAIARGDVVDLRNLADDKLAGQISHSATDGISAMQFSADGKQLGVGYYDGDVIIWDVKQSKIIKQLNVRPIAGGSNYIWFNSDLSRAVVTNGDDQGILDNINTGHINVWDLQAEKLIIQASTKHLFDRMEFSPNGDVVAVGGRDFGVEVWDAVTGKLLAWLHAPDEEDQMYQLQYFHFSPDGSLIGVVGGDDAITLYGIPNK